MMRNIQIPNPCSENWEIMTPQEKGRFCAVCSKCVVDFTQKNPEEIKQIFIENNNETICGRFYNHQLSDSKTNKTNQLKTRFFKYIPSYFQNNRIVLTVFSLILFLTGCSKQKEESCSITTGIVVEDVEINTAKNNDFVIGEAVIEDDSIAKIHRSDHDTMKDKSVK